MRAVLYINGRAKKDRLDQEVYSVLGGTFNAFKEPLVEKFIHLYGDRVLF